MSPPTPFSRRAALSLAVAATMLAGCATSTTEDEDAVSAASPSRDRILDLACGDRRAELRFEGGEVTLVVDRAAVRVVEEPAASSRRWTANVLDDTWIAHQGEEYLVSFQGRRLPPCVASERPPKPLVAIVHEPSFRLSILGAAMTVVRPGHEPVEIPIAGPSVAADGEVYRGTLDGAALTLRIERSTCRDSMTGMPHPATAWLTIGGESHRGCAGDPVDLLTVGEWLIESVGGEPVADEPPATIEFLPEGRIAGSGGCNRYGGSFALGEGLTIGPNLFSTMMACAEPAMASERRVLDALPTTSAFDIDESGRLILTIADGRTLVARRR